MVRYIHFHDPSGIEGIVEITDGEYTYTYNGSHEPLVELLEWATERPVEDTEGYVDGDEVVITSRERRAPTPEEAMIYVFTRIRGRANTLIKEVKNE